MLVDDRRTNASRCRAGGVVRGDRTRFAEAGLDSLTATSGGLGRASDILTCRVPRTAPASRTRREFPHGDPVTRFVHGEPAGKTVLRLTVADRAGLTPASPSRSRFSFAHEEYR